MCIFVNEVKTLTKDTKAWKVVLKTKKEGIFESKTNSYGRAIQQDLPESMNASIRARLNGSYKLRSTYKLNSTKIDRKGIGFFVYLIRPDTNGIEHILSCDGRALLSVTIPKGTTIAIGSNNGWDNGKLVALCPRIRINGELKIRNGRYY